MKNHKIIVFVRNKLITLDTVLPLLIEVKNKYNISSEIVVFDKLAHDAIYKNVVLSDAVDYVGREIFIGNGLKNKLFRRFFILLSLFRLMFGFFRGDKIIHFGHLNKWPLKLIALIFSKNTYQMQGSAYSFKYSEMNRSMKNLVLPTPMGENIIICADDLKLSAFKNIDQKKKIFYFGETRTRKSWVDYVNSKSEYYFKNYHPSIDLNKGPIIFILGAIDAYPKKHRLFHLTIEALSRIEDDIPILLKPHAFTEMETVYNAINGLDSFHITYLHPSVLATNARVFISNNFSNTLADAHSFGVKTIEYSNNDVDMLKQTNFGSTDPQYVDYFINNDNIKFINILNEVLGEEYNRSSFQGQNIDDNGLFKSFLN
jgi:hypothetical protein